MKTNTLGYKNLSRTEYNKVIAYVDRYFSWYKKDYDTDNDQVCFYSDGAYVSVSKRGWFFICKEVNGDRKNLYGNFITSYKDIRIFKAIVMALG